MSIDKSSALKIWKDCFGDKEWAQDCFGTWMYRDGFNNEKFIMLRPGNTEKHDYSWNIDHIRPKSSFDNPDDADFFNNYEPMHRINNLEKSDDYPTFTINGKKYEIVKITGKNAYGIKDRTGQFIDVKSKSKWHYRS